MLHIIDYWCYFEQAIAVFPTRFDYAVPKRLMFGKLITRISQQQDFPTKNALLEIAKKLNEDCRIPAAHKLLHRGTLPQIEYLARDCKALFQQIMDCYSEARTYFYSRYDSLAEKTGIQYDKE